VSIPPESLPPELLTVDEDGAQVVLGEDPTAPGIFENRDGTWSLVQDKGRLPDELTPVDPVGDLCARRLLELAVARVLLQAEVHQADADKLVKGLPAGARSFFLKRVFLGHPKANETHDPMPSATVMVAGKVQYPNETTPTLLEPTWGRWAPGTVLRRIGSANATVEITAWVGDKELRYAIEAAIERAFLAEASEERMAGRRIVLPEYYNTTARMRLLDIEDLADQESVREGRWIVTASVLAEIDRVILVSGPPAMDPRFEAEVEP